MRTLLTIILIAVLCVGGVDNAFAATSTCDVTSSNVNPSIYGESVSYTANWNPQCGTPTCGGGAPGPPTGTINWYANGGLIDITGSATTTPAASFSTGAIAADSGIVMTCYFNSTKWRVHIWRQFQCDTAQSDHQ